MTSLTDTQVVTASGGLVELASTSVVDEVFITDSTPSGTANVVPNISVVCDGSPVLVELYSPMAYPDPFSAASWFSLGLVYDGARTGSGNGHWTYMQNDGTGYDINPLHLSMRMTPTAGVHTFGVNGYRNTGTARIGGTTSQRGMDAIQFRVSKIVQASQWPAVTTGTIICTSSTRPASPFEGQVIYETDTGLSLIYDGSAWVSPSVTHKTPAAAATMSGSHTSSGSWQAITWSSELFDTDGIFAPSDYQFDIQTTGLYLVTLKVGFLANATANRAAQVRKNGNGTSSGGSRLTGMYWEAPAPSTGALDLTCSGVHQLAAGDTVEGLAYQASGGNLTYQNMYFSVAYLGQS